MTLFIIFKMLFTFPPAVSHARLLNCRKCGWLLAAFCMGRFAMFVRIRFELILFQIQFLFDITMT